jgi:hypothetical protein
VLSEGDLFDGKVMLCLDPFWDTLDTKRKKMEEDGKIEVEVRDRSEGFFK